MMAIASLGGVGEHRLLAHLAKGLHALYLGDLIVSRDHFEDGLAFYEPSGQERREYQHIGDPGSFSYSYLARALWILGDVDRAFDCSHQSLTLARTLKIPLPRAQALGMHTLLLLVRRDNAQARQYAGEAIEYASRHGFAYWLVLGSMCEGWLIAQEGDADRGIEQFRRFLDLYLQQGAKLGLSWFLGVLGEMHAQSGRHEEASDLLGQALAHVEETGERYYEAEIHRLEGELALLRGDRAAAEQCFQCALSVAQRQSAVSWELRAAVSLGRLWRSQGRIGDANDLVAVAYEAATNQSRHPSPDRDDAKRLLGELQALM
jgi:predicted ATPase